MSSRTSYLKLRTPLSQALPGAQFGEKHVRIVAAEPDRVWEALHDLTWGDLRLTLPLIAIRTAGAHGSLGRRLIDPPSPAVPLFEDAPKVSASGMIGRPWNPRPTPGPIVETLDELRAFDDAGWLKYGMEWLLSPLPGGRTLVETATLCEATDAYALRRFAAYWTLIRGFSGLVRRDILAALVRGAT